MGRCRGVALAVFALALASVPSAGAQTSLVSCTGSDWNCQTTELGPSTGALAMTYYTPCLPGATAAPAPDSSTRLELCSNGGSIGWSDGWEEPVVLVHDGHEIAVRKSFAIGHGGTCTRHNLLVRIDEQRVGLRAC